MLSLYLRMLVVCIGVVGLTACGSSRIRVESDPGDSTVTVVRAGGATQVLGKTPIEIDRRQVPELFSRPVVLQIQKDGFLPDTLFIPPSHVGVRGEVTTKLSQASLPAGCSQGEAALEEVSQGVAEIQYLTQKKDYESAFRVGNGLLSRYPKVSILYSLLGNIHYLRRDTAMALDFYKRAKNLNPSNRDNLRMIEKLDTIRGTTERSPSSGGGEY